VKKPTACKGPSVTLQYVPKTCILDAEAKAAVCDPAKLVLTKTPGSCNLKYYTAPKWVGKECKVSGEVGTANEMVVGGRQYDVALSSSAIHMLLDGKKQN